MPATPVHQQALWENERRERESLPFFPFHHRSLPPSLFFALSCLLSRSSCIPISPSFFLPTQRFSFTVCFLSLIVSQTPPTTLPLQPQNPRNMTQRQITHASTIILEKKHSISYTHTHTHTQTHTEFFFPTKHTSRPKGACE